MEMISSPKPRSLVVLAAERAARREAQIHCLSAAGFPVLDVVSTDEVLSALDSRSDVRVLIVEPQMPGCFSGLALARFVSKRWPEVAILISGWPTEPVLALPAGITFLPDECLPTQILEAVQARAFMSSASV
jgi:FixJ family two-component response regulator